MRSPQICEVDLLKLIIFEKKKNMVAIQLAWGLSISIRLRANGRNIVAQQLPTLLDVTCCVLLHTLLYVVACCCGKFETSQTFQSTTPNISLVT